jgi:hypothetical protein
MQVQALRRCAVGTFLTNFNPFYYIFNQNELVTASLREKACAIPNGHAFPAHFSSAPIRLHTRNNGGIACFPQSRQYEITGSKAPFSFLFSMGGIGSALTILPLFFVSSALPPSILSPAPPQPRPLAAQFLRFLKASFFCFLTPFVIFRLSFDAASAGLIPSSWSPASEAANVCAGAHKEKYTRRAIAQFLVYLCNLRT